MYVLYEDAYCENDLSEEHLENYTYYDNTWSGDSCWFESFTQE